ncbi:MAG: cytochrome c3 family protein [Desulfobacter sp.]|nr:MAG: cytochrome c3 family protein [Desulfobacter sp.]
MKNKVFIFLAAALLTLGLSLAAQANDPEPAEFEAPEDGLEINFIQGHSDRDLSVEFNHSSHESYECIDCHHRMGELKGRKPPRSCAACHDNFSPDDLKGYKSYFKAMHKIRYAPNAERPSCLHCHTNEFGADDKDMTGCNASACHSDGIR